MWGAAVSSHSSLPLVPEPLVGGFVMPQLGAAMMPAPMGAAGAPHQLMPMAQMQDPQHHGMFMAAMPANPGM
jgi:hypothetical protein